MHEQGYLNQMFTAATTTTATSQRQYAELPPAYNAMITTAYAEPYEWNRVFIRPSAPVGMIRILHFTFPKPHRRDLCEEYLVASICALWPSSSSGRSSV